MPPPHADNTTNTFDCWEPASSQNEFQRRLFLSFFFLFFFFFLFDSFPRELARVGLVPWQCGFPADKLFKAAEEGRLREAQCQCQPAEPMAVAFVSKKR